MNGIYTVELSKLQLIYVTDFDPLHHFKDENLAFVFPDWLKSFYRLVYPIR